MTLEELQRIKQWHVDHKADHPLEYHLWDAFFEGHWSLPARRGLQ